jgi:cytochrome c553
VSTHSRGIDVPALDAPHLVVKGAALYEMNCSWCHGSPAMRNPAIPAAMTPHPPDLVKATERFDAAGLFYITKHGIKFTGMPAWPAPLRDDEVWAVVAFLQRLPQLSADEYLEMAHGPVADPAPHTEVDDPLVQPGPPESPPEAVAVTCSMCHGTDGEGRGNGAFPKLASQSDTYLRESLLAFARGDRHSGVMGPIAEKLSEADIAELAEFYSQLPGDERPPSQAGEETTTGEAALRGEQIAQTGIPDERIPSCIDCHGPRDTRRQDHYPVLAGQYHEYLELQLQLFRQRRRGGTSFAEIMHKVVENLGDEEIRDVARYYESIQGARE